MKKTLFTLMAAVVSGGMAVSAAENFGDVLQIGDTTLSLTEVTLGTSGKNSTKGAGITTNDYLVWDTAATPNTNTFTLVFQLNQANGTGNLITIKTSGTSKSPVGPSLALKSDKLVFTKGGGDLLTNESTTTALDATVGNVYMWSYVFETNTEYLTNLTTGDVHVVALNNDGFTNANKELTSNSAVAWTNGNKNHVTLLGVADLSSTVGGMTSAQVSDALTGAKLVTKSSPSVPEPATSTLSLLALAGLAARRRR